MAQKSHKNRMLLLFPGALAMMIALSACNDMTRDPKSFASPQQAVTALVNTVQSGNDADLLALLGPESKDLVSSGDPVADRNGRARFLKAYEKKHTIEQEDEGRAVLLIGNRNYPFPIPVIRQGNLWRFDTEAGKEEILNRRIGRNELHTIEVMQAYTDAQREYACLKRPDGREFAQKFTSSEGKKDGLYWQAGEGEKESPFGPLIAKATKKGYAGALDKDPAEPFRGYYFKILKGQGEHARGGAFDYVANGKMVLGFALVAYPAKYGASGIMTFIVNQEGIIYEKDLSADTSTASAITTFSPDDTWRKYEEPADN